MMSWGMVMLTLVITAVPLVAWQLAELAVLEVLQTEELLACIANLDQIQPLLSLKATTADKHKRRRTKSAIYIQAMIRGHLGRKKLRQMKADMRASVTIQAACRTFVSIRKMYKRLRSKREAEAEKWEALSATLRSHWKSISSGAEHYIVHLPSLSIEEHLRLGMSDFVHRQNQQLSRIYGGISTRHASVIYVSPVFLPEELMDYTRRLFERLGVSSRRLHILVPENADRFPRHFPLSSLLYYSPRCLRRIRSLVKGRPAYIVPGVPNWQDKKLAELLNIPLLCPDPYVLQEYSAKSGLKRAFAEASINIPLGAHDIYNEETLILALTKLIAGNLLVDRWLIKLDVDYESMSWAYLDVCGMDSVLSLRKEKAKLEQINSNNPSVWHHHDVQLIARSKIIKDLKGFIEKSLVLCTPDIFPNYASFLNFLARYGAVVEAEPKHVRGYPAVSLLIDPFGQVAVRATYDLVIDPVRYVRLASLSPVCSVPARALEGAAQSIGRKLYDRKVIGHVMVRFVAFHDSGRKQMRLWALEATFGLSSYAASHEMFQLVRGSISSREQLRKDVERAAGLDRQPSGMLNGGPSTEAGDSVGASSGGGSSNKPCATATHYAVIDSIEHPSFASITLPAFFKACRLERIAYNMDNHRGLLFLLTDRLSAGGVGIMGLGGSVRETVGHVLSGLDFLKRQLGSKTLNNSEEGRLFLKTMAMLSAIKEGKDGRLIVPAR